MDGRSLQVIQCFAKFQVIFFNFRSQFKSLQMNFWHGWTSAKTVSIWWAFIWCKVLIFAELYFSCMISHQSQRIVLTRLNTHSVFLPAPLSIHLSGPLARKYLYPVVRFGWQFLHPQSSVAVLCRCWHAQQSHIMLLVVLVNGAAWHKMKSVYKV